jgi:hypothetical protein
MSPEASREFLDQLQAHVPQPEFRCDHPRIPGDVTIWDNPVTLRNSPPMKSGIASVDDAPLLYRLSGRGDPAPRLPRHDAPG